MFARYSQSNRHGTALIPTADCLPSPSFIHVETSSVSLIVSYTRVEVSSSAGRYCSNAVFGKVPALGCLSVRGMPFYSSVCFSISLNRLENDFCKKESRGHLKRHGE